MVLESSGVIGASVADGMTVSVGLFLMVKKEPAFWKWLLAFTIPVPNQLRLMQSFPGVALSQDFVLGPVKQPLWSL